METKNNDIKNINEMSKDEQIDHYKNLFVKSKKLIKHYEDEKTKLVNVISSLKEKLKEYETGIITSSREWKNM
jgi:hypothetical protein